MEIKKNILRLLFSYKGESLFWRSWRGRGLILSFHGVVPDEIAYMEYPYANFVTESMFRAQMSYLKEKCRPISLRSMVKCLQNNNPLPERSVAVTFDDGYKNNATLAVPVLNSFDIPATVFVASRYIGGKKMIPAEELKLLLYYSARARMIATDVLDGVSRAEKDLIPWIQSAVKAFKSLSPEHAEKILNTLGQQADINQRQKKQEPFEFMELYELQALAKKTGIEIGAHTANHCILSRLSDDKALKEIADNKKDMNNWTGQETDLFAYPNGQFVDFSDRDQLLLKQQGFSLACTQVPGYVKHDSNVFALPRFDIGQGYTLPVFKGYICGMIPFLKRVK